MDNISSSRGGSSSFLFNKGSMKFNLNDQKVLNLQYFKDDNFLQFSIRSQAFFEH